MIDLYCERLGPEFWAEPINAITNLSFLIAAIATWRLTRRLNFNTRRTSVEAWLLILLMVAIGLGSGLFHTYATRWAMLADITPILLFQLVFLWLYGRDMIAMSTSSLVIAMLVFFAAAVVARGFPELLNGSLIYAPALILLVALGAYHLFHAQVERTILLWASTVFLLALTFRSIDMVLCPNFPTGTHFLWHLFNGLLVYLTARSWLISKEQSGQVA